MRRRKRSIALSLAGIAFTLDMPKIYVGTIIAEVPFGIPNEILIDTRLFMRLDCEAINHS
jgi:energy-converting hydrogenase Eha subunit F